VLAAGGRVAGVVEVEAPEDYVPVLDHFRRSLLLTWIVLTAAIGAFALLRVRQARAAERLERRLARSETLAAMGRLTATLAHEIKNPLAIIRGSAERLGKLEPEARRMADFVVEETDRLSRTVARYLDFARGGDGGEGTGDAIEALETTLALLEGEATARRVTLERGPGEPGGQPVPLDNESLKQIYLNLILNAMEAMPEGGRISISDRIADGTLEVRVADQGPGFPPEQLKTLGTPFLSTKARGSGLGLFLSRRLAQSAGGDLELRNAPEGGAECVLKLPMKRRT
jgi:signal transduction histidine kinase